MREAGLEYHAIGRPLKVLHEPALKPCPLNCADLSACPAGARVWWSATMLDRYWFGEVNRISPEAPVPVAKITRIEERAGGAANVARNITPLGGPASLLSVVGDDEAASALETLLRDGIATRRQDQHQHSTTKLRVVARQQQLIRIDFEEAPATKSWPTSWTTLPPAWRHDVVILSDYGKGGSPTSPVWSSWRAPPASRC